MGLEGEHWGVRNRVKWVGQKSMGVGMMRKRLGQKARPWVPAGDTAEKAGSKGRGWQGVCVPHSRLLLVFRIFLFSTASFLGVTYDSANQSREPGAE